MHEYQRGMRRSIFHGVAALLIAGLTACASFNLTNSWRSPEFSGPPLKKVLVIGLSQSDATRRIFEDGFVQALNSAGVGAVSSYGPLPEKGQIPNERLKAAVAQTGSDSILITRLMQVEKRTDVIAPAGPYYRAGFYGFYGSTWAAGPVSVDTYNVLSFETTLWDMRKETVVWTGTTEGIQSSDVAKATQGMAQVLIEKMKKDGVI